MHWRAPTTMLAAFVAGLAFAIGHHFFYQSLDGIPVNNARFQQQINIGIGTAFAFLVRASFVIAVGVAFVQVLWRGLLNKEITISTIDSMTQLQTSLLDLFNFRTISQHPRLAFLAFITWTLPFAAIVPPATLTVISVVEPRVGYETRDLPLLDFAKDTFTKLYVANPLDAILAPNQIQYQYFGGSQDALSQLSMSTALQADIPSIRPPALNSSYELPFYGPAIQCSPTSAEIIKDFDSVFGCNFSDPTRSGTQPCGFDYSYLSWVPAPGNRVPLSASDGDLNFNPRYTGSDYGMTTTGGFDGEPTMMFIGTHRSQTWSILNCSLFNASYSVKFNFQDGFQSISSKRSLLNSLPFINLVETEMLADVSGYPPPGTVTPVADLIAVSFQAVMDSFGKIIVGGINYAVSTTGGGNNVLSTSIMSTNLRSCAELGGNGTSLSLADSAEQLFENITLELFSRSEYVSVNASKFPSTNVTLHTFPNVYNYTWSRLALAYGLAALFAGVAVVIGGFTLLVTGRSYNNTFSTVIRTTRHRAIDRLIRPEDSIGQDPLPEHIARARITVGAGKLDEEDKMDSSTELEEHSSHEGHEMQAINHVEPDDPDISDVEDAVSIAHSEVSVMSQMSDERRGEGQLQIRNRMHP